MQFRVPVYDGPHPRWIPIDRSDVLSVFSSEDKALVGRHESEGVLRTDLNFTL